jgi:hypothetical protein
MTCPKLAKAWMRGDGPAFVTLGGWLWRGRTPMNVRQKRGCTVKDAAL